MASPRARRRSCVSSLEASATATSVPSCSSVSTRPPIISGASCARPAAPTAPRRRLTRTVTALRTVEPHEYHRPMPLYIIERTFAEQLDVTDDDVQLIDEINADEGVRWLFSF